ncbi:MAG: Ribosome recycling factor [uncultured Thermomicrobiales bacterium]|uniref:Ribosome-recycling factor n=1 Tax=uncultured Thermomicrobiales bacterium TaxID=1645740 RepID=A0A6J4UX84_9BACT|nr:MAG: Ribosome recycling factor [uncultured Thermomicrobiales bacterium]
MIADVAADAESRMRKAIDALHRDLEGVRTGRASPALVDRITVDYYGASTPLNQLAGVSVPEPRLLVIQPWDKGTMGLIEKAIQKSDLGLNPNNDGQVIRISIPPLTADRRKQLVKVVHGNVEDAKVAIRNVRRDAMNQLKALLQDKEISENDERRASHQLDELTKRFTDETDKVGKAKETEVLEV